MTLMIHEPKQPADSEELARLVAQIHGEAIITYIQGLPLSREEKLVLLRGAYQNNKKGSD